ncbi:MAG TPA: ATPase, T2SS/T4P/T4SS family [bacterium]|nr:ATPase, T2SS/T4P/T4SS family [bacterium]
MAFRPRSGFGRPPASEKREPAKPASQTAPAAPVSAEKRDAFGELKSHIHQTLINRLDLSVLITVDRTVLQSQIGRVTESLLLEEGLNLTPEVKERLITEIRDELLGLGPLEQYMNRPEVSDILVNGYNQVYIEEGGKLQLTETRFKDNDHLMKIIDRIVTRVGRRLDEASPMVDARLPDGSRVNAIIPPLALDGPMLSIRRFRTNVLSIEDLLERGSITPPLFEFLKGAIKSRLNIVISGGTGSGKTTLLNILSAYIPDDERIVTIEDSAELQLQQPHVIRLETRPPNIEGRGTVTQRDLLRNALRMRPDRILIGEVRGAEIYDMLQAMNTGHDGSLTTIHANSTRDCLLRLETLMLLSGIDIPGRAIRELIASSINLLVQVTRYSDGSRRVSSISEIVGMEQSTITLQEIFRFERQGLGEGGRVLGVFRPTGIRPKAVNHLAAAGIQLPTELFDPEGTPL